MPIFYSILVGVIMGLAKLSIFASILIIITLILVNTAKDIIFKKSFFTGVSSPYQLYLANLEELNRSKKYAIAKYLIKSLISDGIIALVVFTIVRLVF